MLTLLSFVCEQYYYYFLYFAIFYMTANIPESSLLNKTLQKNWVVEHVIKVRDNYLDGINIDFESAIPANRSDLREAYTDLVRLTYEDLKDLHPYLQVGVFVPDRRWFDTSSSRDLNL